MKCLINIKLNKVANKLKYEDAVRIIRENVARAELGFQREAGRFPSLVNEQDYLLLANHLNIQKLCNDYGTVDNGGEILPVHDVAYILIRNHLERQNFFRDLGEQRKDAFDGFVGALDYNPPEREYLMRIDALNRLRSHSEEFPSDFPEFVGHIKDISKRCFLKQLRETNHSGREKAYENIGTWIVNPSSQIHLWLSGESRGSFDGLIKTWREFAEESRHYGNSRSYD